MSVKCKILILLLRLSLCAILNDIIKSTLMHIHIGCINALKENIYQTGATTKLAWRRIGNTKYQKLIS